MTADVTREPTGGQGLREAIARALDDTAAGLWMGQHGPGWGAVAADAVLALPELAALIADADNWRRVTTGDPTEPEPLAMQARTLLLQVRRVRALADDLALHTVEPTTDFDRGFIRGLDTATAGLRRALDGEPQP